MTRSLAWETSLGLSKMKQGLLGRERPCYQEQYTMGLRVEPKVQEILLSG